MGTFEIVSFLTEASSDVPTDVLIDDLREAMSVFPMDLERKWREFSPLYDRGWSWADFRERTAFKPPLEICAVTGIPLIPPIMITKVPEIHRVILAAQHASLQRLTQPKNR